VHGSGSGSMSGKKSGEDVKKSIDEEAKSKSRKLSVALVGKESTFVNIFHVLQQLNLAKPFDDGKGKDAVGAGNDKIKGKDKDKSKPVNLVKDKKSGQRYLVDPLPSVIISITGDAQDLPEDHEFVQGVDDLMRELGKLNGEMKLNREAASRAISLMAANNKQKIKEAVDKLPKPEESKEDTKAASSELSMCMQISLLLQARMRELEQMKDAKFTDSKNKEYTLKDAFKDRPSARDVMLNVLMDKDTQFKSLKEYRFTDEDVEGKMLKAKPVVISKRLPKAR